MRSQGKHNMQKETDDQRDHWPRSHQNTPKAVVSSSVERKGNVRWFLANSEEDGEDGCSEAEWRNTRTD
uniref:Uncharacterized protein n=1 Tax=Arundo donax TaxID=35708 RepID=A0A0A8Y8D4_ARUDO